MTNLRLLPSFLGLYACALGLAALLAAATASDASAQPAVNTGEREPTHDICGCGVGCGCGSSCGCVDQTFVGQPDAPGLTGFPANDILVLSRISLPEFGAQFENGNDCWGYTSPSGREYAIMGLSHGAAFVEVTDPVNPQVLNIIAHPGSLWGDIKVHGHHAYIVNETGGGLQVADMSQIDSGVVTLVNTVTLGGSLATTHNLALDTDSARLYLCGANSPTSGLVIFSLANPASPALVGTYSGVYVHDAHVVTYTEGPHAGRQLAYCFVGDRGIDIVDVTNPAATVRLSRTVYGGLSYSHQGWVDVDRQILFMDDELDEDNTVNVTTTRVFNVEEPEFPVYMGSFTSGLPAIDHNQYFHEGFIYQANYRSGLRIFDVRTSPTNPTQVGWLDTYMANDEPFFNGAWSVYPFFESGTVIISDIEGGLFVVDPTFALIGGAPFGFDFADPLPTTLPPSNASIDLTIEAFNGQTFDPNSPPSLHVDLGAGFMTLPLVDHGDGLYTAAFPTLPCNGTVRYYFSAQTPEGVTVNEPLSAPAETYGAEVFTFDIITAEDAFEVTSGWVVGAPGDNATTGVWTRVNPVGTSAQPEDDHTPEGVMCFVTGQGSPGGSVGTNDVDGGATTLTSPPFDALAETDGDAYVSYWRWYSNDQGSAPGSDSMPVQISSDGVNWVELESVSENLGVWKDVTFRVADFVTPSAQIRLRFVARDLGSGSVVEAGVDDVRVEFRGCEATVVAGDTNGDGVVDFEDLNNVLGLYNQTGPGLIGDVDGDGDVDFEDLNIVLGSYNQPM